MKRKTIALFLSLGVLAAVVPLATAHETEGFTRYPLARGTAAPIHIQTLLVNDVVTQSVSIAPGANSGWYSDPGQELLTVTQGTLTVYSGESADCKAVKLGAGSTTVGSGSSHLVANKTRKTVTLLVQYFNVQTPSGDPAPPAPKPANCGAVKGSTSGFERTTLARAPAHPLDIRTSETADVVTQRVTVAVGASSGWHIHPGMELVTVRPGRSRSGRRSTPPAARSCSRHRSPERPTARRTWRGTTAPSRSSSS